MYPFTPLTRVQGTKDRFASAGVTVNQEWEVPTYH